jgi:hypothetical protein
MKLRSSCCGRCWQIEANISIGIVARVGGGVMIDFRLLDCRLDVNDLIEAEEDEFRRLRMVFGSVFALPETSGGIKERIC